MARWLFVVFLTALAVVSTNAASAAESTDVMVGVSGQMRARLITPDGPGPYPGILVLHTSGGAERADFEFARNLAEQGYVTLVPFFLDAYGITYATRRESFTTHADAIYADFVSALDMLRHNPKVIGTRLGAVGFSNGGYFAVWLAATGNVQAGVSYYGAVTGAGSDRTLSRFRNAFTKTSSPVLILHGGADDTVPVGAAEELAAIIARAGSPYEIKVYDDAGHRFERTGGAADEAAAADAWPRTLAFLTKYLKQP